ncbi:hypothetical protein LCGC14_2099540 [marine sediment metagenome]|uniref:Uncharacterized protein n=1 Tax=marine sediment metagenome TaxID=412755 RepID=A0A0F9EXK3_9ZZZZ
MQTVRGLRPMLYLSSFAIVMLAVTSTHTVLPALYQSAKRKSLMVHEPFVPV